MIEKTIDLEKKLNSVLARDSSRNRSLIIKKTNIFAGLVSEYIWATFIRKYAKKNNIIIEISYGDFSPIDLDQVDIYTNKYKKITAEVRSSFPYTGINKAVIKNFDIIGWYENDIKTKEIKKDFYLRVLYPYNIKDFPMLIKSEFNAFISGGASKELLESSKYAKYKKFKPLSEHNHNLGKITQYRVLETIINGFGSMQLTKKILDI